MLALGGTLCVFVSLCVELATQPVCTPPFATLQGDAKSAWGASLAAGLHALTEGASATALQAVALHVAQPRAHVPMFVLAS